MTSKNRGYLLVDLSIALAIFSILSFGIFTFYKTYKRIDNDNKTKVEYLNYMHYISMELKHNLEFDILKSGLGKKYYLDIKNISNINELIEKSNLLVESIGKTEEIVNANYDLNEYIVINIVNEGSDSVINENILNIEIKAIKNNKKCIYENVIKRYKYIL